MLAGNLPLTFGCRRSVPVSHDLRRISLFGIVFLVLLRISIGWHFLYEGLWKYQTQSTAKPWSAEGYLLNAQGPFRSFFRGMVDDPNDLNWLDYEHVRSDWETWAKKFARHYELTEEQRQSLDEMLYGLEVYEVPLKRMPEGKEEFTGENYGPTIPFIVGFRPAKEPGKPGRLYVKEGQEFLPEHVRRIKELVPKDEEFLAAVDALYEKFTSTSRVYTEELKVLLEEDKGLTGEPIKDEEGNIVEKPPGEIAVYKAMLADYETELANADRESNYEHLKTKWSKIQEKRSELVDPVKDLDSDLKNEAYDLLTAEQRQNPPLPPEPTNIGAINQRTMWALMILGGLLIAGFFTRISAFLGAGMVLMFYLVYPPWPGVPPAPGPEHSFIVNKNFIEIMALLALTFLPTGSWFGVDGIFRRLFTRNQSGLQEKSAKPKQEQKPVSVKT